MHGRASPHGLGGGAMHVALGRNTTEFPIEAFLSSRGQANVVIDTAEHPGHYGASRLILAGDPDRRQGEWIIRDQYSNRHPALSPSEGFPDVYSTQNPPFILLFRVANAFHIRFAEATYLAVLDLALAAQILAEQKGIAVVTPGFLEAFSIPPDSLLNIFSEQQEHEAPSEFDPETVEDGREQVFRAIIRRQGQPAFRMALLSAYQGRCAVTNTRTVVVLEAAHIMPYRGAQTNSVQNGLLLRADIHTLFDIGLISIEPSRRLVRVSDRLKGSDYMSFEGKSVFSPRNRNDWPTKAALQYHFNRFQG